jgi:hypothetical protein
VEGLRSARPVKLLELTNYRADGSPFRNLLSVQPVHDSSGEYRYCIGVLADASTLKSDERADYERLCRLLPITFDASIQPFTFPAGRRMRTPTPSHTLPAAVAKNVPPASFRPRKLGSASGPSRQWSDSLDRSMALKKLIWLEDPPLSVCKLVEDAHGATTFKQYLVQRSEGACEQLSFVTAMEELEDMGQAERHGAMTRIAMVHLPNLMNSSSHPPGVEQLFLELDAH